MASVFSAEVLVRRFLAAFFLLSGLLVAGGANAAGDIRFASSGSNVVVTISGNVDTTALSAGGGGTYPPQYYQDLYANIGWFFTPGQCDVYYGISGPANWIPVGANPPGARVNSATGDKFGLYPQNSGQLCLPVNYQSGTPLSGTATFQGQSIGSLGLKPGVYTYTLGNGGPVILTVTVVPPPPTVNPSNASLAINATTLTIDGTGFDTTAGNNTVRFNLGAAGTVTSATATQLTVNLTTPPSTTGSLTAVVTTNGQSSGSDVQVATVVLATQATLAVTSVPTSIYVNGTSTLSASGGSGLGTVTYSLDSGPCTLSGATLTGTGAGDCIVTATKAADSPYDSATSSPVTVAVSLAPQATLVVVPTPSSINVNGTSTLSATGGSGSGAVSYSLVSGPCTLNSATLTGTGAGSCIVTATKAADSTYDSATSSQVTVAVSLAPQATLVVVPTPSSINVNGTSTLSATGGSGSGAVSYSLVSGPCTLSGATLTGTGAGSCIVTATQAADSTYDSATSSPVTVAVSLATQATLVVVPTPSSINVNGTTTLSTTGGSGSGAVTYNLVSGPCTLSGATLTGTGAGSCIVTATKAADSTYNSATSAQVTVVIPAPVDCVVSSWSAFGQCSASCGGGTQTQTRTVTTPAANGGAACPALSQSQACNTQACQYQAPVTTPGGAVNAGITSGSFITTQAATPTNPPAGQSFPYGVFGFTAATNTLGGSITITLTYPQALAAGSKIWKNINGTWLDYTSNVTFNPSRTTITYTIVDGGPFDSDGVVNQSVTDPIGPAPPTQSPSPEPIPTLSEWAKIMMMFLMILTVGWYGRRLKQR